MTVSTLRPDSTTSNTGTLTGGATAHAVLSDDSDASYAHYLGQSSVVGLGDLTLPAGAVIKSVALRARSALFSGSANPLTLTVENVPWSLTGAVNVTWGVPTTVTFATRSAAGMTDAELDGATLRLSTSGVVGGIRAHEAYVDVTHVALPTLTADVDPASPISTTNQPTITWVNTLDSDGGAQTRFEVKVFDDATYLGGGFDPDTSTPDVTSGETSSSAAEWQVDEPLADDTYRAYVRVAQTVNGVLHWSDWDFVEFDVAVDLPAAPTFTATADSANARIQLDFDDNVGDATTDFFEVQRSLDGGVTWETVRQLVAGHLTPSGGTFQLFDYEAPNGVETDYRGRALHDYGSGSFAASAWVTDAATWTSSDWWLKHPNRPALNTTVPIRSFQTVARAGRQGVFQPLGATHAVVVSDTEGPLAGTVVLRLDTTADQADLDALRAAVGPTLMLQSPPDEGGPDYLVILNRERTRVTDMAAAAPSFDALEFVQVDRPTGDVVAWPV
jgi:hypothetical protein